MPFSTGCDGNNHPFGVYDLHGGHLLLPVDGLPDFPDNLGVFSVCRHDVPVGAAWRCFNKSPADQIDAAGVLIVHPDTWT